jgi:signal transduction histidine kinase
VTARRRRGGSLRFRVTALAGLAVLAVLTAAGVGLTLTHRGFVTSNLDESLADRADVVAQRLRAGRAVAGTDLPTDDVVVQVVDSSGSVLAASRDLPPRRIWSDTPRRTKVADGTMPNSGTDARVLATPVGDATVYVAGTLEDVQASTRALARSLLVAVPVASVLLAGLVWLLVGRVLRPVEAIRTEVDRISAGDLDRRVPEPPTTDEIARLAHTMNAMLGRLADASGRQRRFVADAAHELRSPLARMRTELEVDLAHPETAQPAATAAGVLAEVITLQRLVDDLLLLARGDAGALDPRRDDAVDFDDLVQRRVAAFRAAGERRLDSGRVTPVQVNGDPDQLERVIGNLLDNAVRHARERVVVTLAEDGEGWAELAVDDDGPGVPPADRDRVFERFTRLDEARSARDGGAGLGLAIAHDIAERHGGSLRIDSEGAPGARFVLRLPVSRATGAGDPDASR